LHHAFLGAASRGGVIPKRLTSSVIGRIEVAYKFNMEASRVLPKGRRVYKPRRLWKKIFVVTTQATKLNAAFIGRRLLAAAVRTNGETRGADLEEDTGRVCCAKRIRKPRNVTTGETRNNLSLRRIRGWDSVSLTEATELIGRLTATNIFSNQVREKAFFEIVRATGGNLLLKILAGDFPVVADENKIVCALRGRARSTVWANCSAEVGAATIVGSGVLNDPAFGCIEVARDCLENSTVRVVPVFGLGKGVYVTPIWTNCTSRSGARRRWCRGRLKSGGVVNVGRSYKKRRLGLSGVDESADDAVVLAVDVLTVVHLEEAIFDTIVSSVTNGEFTFISLRHCSKILDPKV